MRGEKALKKGTCVAFIGSFMATLHINFIKKLVSKCIFVMSHAIVIYFKLFLNAGGEKH